jgi:hypothetical protein
MAAHLATANFERATQPRRGPEPMNRGELYQYYKRIGQLEVFFTLFPGG